MYLLLYLGEVLVLVHVVLDLSLAHPGSFGGAALPGEVAGFVAVIALSGWGSCFWLYLGHVPVGLFSSELGYVSPASLGVGPRPPVRRRSSS